MQICSSLCGNCSKACSEYMRHELALSGKLTYIYLKNGRKITNTCSLHANKSIMKSKSDVLSLLSSIKPVHKSEPELVFAFPKL
ncbi:MAG: hypothetical protein Q8920_11105 [Bacillota bacterium]|nr:hypothetical protein [Bacillota bacterium]